ncbi:hypothetical protein F5Y17DRAFT_32165 [Xylariaceae sp. FL0594]|nr:hypothetical protein F5Y17DRAFT_32165 [Xylariaceae sp. FL0594]
MGSLPEPDDNLNVPIDQLSYILQAVTWLGLQKLTSSPLFAPADDQYYYILKVCSPSYSCVPACTAISRSPSFPTPIHRITVSAVNGGRRKGKQQCRVNASRVESGRVPVSKRNQGHARSRSRNYETIWSASDGSLPNRGQVSILPVRPISLLISTRRSRRTFSLLFSPFPTSPCALLLAVPAISFHFSTFKPLFFPFCFNERDDEKNAASGLTSILRTRKNDR